MFTDDLLVDLPRPSSDSAAAASGTGSGAVGQPVAERDIDRPLVLQLSGNDPATLAAACALAEKSGALDAIDLNLGCPQQDASDNFCTHTSDPTGVLLVIF
jgi:hypothetical protein